LFHITLLHLPQARSGEMRGRRELILEQHPGTSGTPRDGGKLDVEELWNVE
jgi:hypothetical protein